MNSKNKYDLFISYSTDPDYRLSRKIESFLESFHKINTQNEVELKELQICRDGSDFQMHRLVSNAEKHNQKDKESFIQDIIVGYLKSSDYLLVLCSENSAKSPHVNFEVEWFLKNKGKEHILLAISEDKQDNGNKIFSKHIVDSKIHLLPFYDFRGFKKESRSWKKVRDFNEELINLAAHLNGDSSGNILPVWKRDELKSLRKRQFYLVGVSIILLVMLIVSVFFWQRAIESDKQTKIALKAEEKQRKLAVDNLKKYKAEEFRRSIEAGDVYRKAQLYDKALVEYIKADTIARDPVYNKITSVQKRIGYLNLMLDECKKRR